MHQNCTDKPVPGAPLMTIDNVNYIFIFQHFIKTSVMYHMTKSHLVNYNKNKQYIFRKLSYKDLMAAYLTNLDFGSMEDRMDYN